MRYLVLGLLLFYSASLFSQTEQNDDVSANPRYFEDQFYAGVTYNFILNQPTDVSQQSISYGLQAGFIKDIPLNQTRTVALGIGFGLALNTYYTNIRALQNDTSISYELAEDDDFKRSKLGMYLLEVPLEFRWRNSDASAYSFWRIYSGIKLGYAFNSRSRYVSESLKDSFENTDVSDFQYGFTLNVGYHNFNVHAYYSLSKLYIDGVNLSGDAIDISPLRIGLIIYIL